MPFSSSLPRSEIKRRARKQRRLPRLKTDPSLSGFADERLADVLPVSSFVAASHEYRKRRGTPKPRVIASRGSPDSRVLRDPKARSERTSPALARAPTQRNDFAISTLPQRKEREPIPERSSADCQRARY